MTRQEAIDNYKAKRIAADNAWSAVRSNLTDFALDEVLRPKAQQADKDLREAAFLRAKYAPSI